MMWWRREAPVTSGPERRCERRHLNDPCPLVMGIVRQVDIDMAGALGAKKAREALRRAREHCPIGPDRDINLLIEVAVQAAHGGYVDGGHI